MSEGEQPRRRGLIVAVAAGVVVAAAAVVVVLVVLNGGEEGEPAPAQRSTPPVRPTTDPSGLPVPEPEIARQTLDYLAGEGAPALTMHEAATGLGDRPTADKCQQVGTALDRDAPPDQLVPITAGVPDEVLRDALGSERVSLVVTISACAQGKTPVYDRVVPLREAVALVQQRLDALEAAR